MSTLVRKLIGRNLLNLAVIALVFAFYLAANWLQVPIMIQIVIVAAGLLSLLKVR
jgi:hypothetical protein